MLRWLALIVFIGLLASAPQGLCAQVVTEDLPIGPFETVHLTNVKPAQVSTLAAAVLDLNRDLHREGCSSCSYQLFVLYAGNGDKPNSMLTGHWPSRAEYLRIHAAEGYAAVNERNPILSTLATAEYYGRFIEVR